MSSCSYASEKKSTNYLISNHPKIVNISQLTKMRCEFIDSQKKTKLLKDENYVYWHYKTNEGKSKAWYRCTKRRADIKCPSTAVYCIETAQILKQIEEHNHSSSIVEQFVCEKQNTLI